MKDTFNREINYLRVSVTDRCDLRCVYCMKEDMKFLPKSQILSSEEINDICSTFIDLGIKKIRITGGEPLIKKGMPIILDYLGKKINNSNLEELTLTTNGTQLYKYAEMIKKNGVKRINVSLDTLDSEKYLKITRGGNLEQVLEGLNIAKKIGLKIKINTVALKNININELDKLVHWCVNKKFDITFIEVMPMDMENNVRFSQYYPLNKVKSFLEKKFQLENSNISTGGPSKYLKIKNSNQKIGFITPLTNNFCESCNRVRLTCTGRVYSCLGHNKFVDLKKTLSKNKKELKKLILKSIYLKPKSHEFEINKKNTNKNLERTMNVTGG